MNEHITYFKALVEGKEDIEDWWTWLSNHEHELDQWLSRGQILRLKRVPLFTIYGILSEKGYSYPRPDHYVHPKFHHPLIVPVEWLMYQVAISDVDRAIPRSSDILRELWNIVRNRLQEGDECWAFESPPQTWMKKMGRAGYAIVRDGEPVDGIVLVLN